MHNRVIIDVRENDRRAEPGNHTGYGSRNAKYEYVIDDSTRSLIQQIINTAVRNGKATIVEDNMARYNTAYTNDDKPCPYKDGVTCPVTAECHGQPLSMPSACPLNPKGKDVRVRREG